MAKESATREERPDVYIGLVCPAGTDLAVVKNQLEAQLSVVGYQPVYIKVSDLIKELLEISDKPNEFDRITDLMNCGDCIRNASENGQGVGSAIIAAIRKERSGSDVPATKAYIIDSLKNPAEVTLLNTIYGRNYYTMSVFRSQSDRLEFLQGKIAKSMAEPPGQSHHEMASKIISEDERGVGKKAQNVRDTFPLADFFVDSSNGVESQIKRFVEVIFGGLFITPTIDEYFMFLARASALRSCDLSRQVGAVIVDEEDIIVSTGCNEVPLPGGGMFVENKHSSDLDNRDYKKGHDPNWIEIQRTLIEIIDLMKGASIINDERDSPKIANEILRGSYKELFTNARLRNLIEFGRVVHAEMHAISEAAAFGRSIKGAKIYTTTFPCHGCARHIISSGIVEVIFIEPYAKSLTEHLYGDEIRLDHQGAKSQPGKDGELVRFRPFQGIAPVLYQRVFARSGRKDDDGTIAKWDPKKAVPLGAVFGVERPKSELAASNYLGGILEAAKLSYKESASRIDGKGKGDGTEISNESGPK
jgi:deoxycytidylate deaminase